MRVKDSVQKFQRLIMFQLCLVSVFLLACGSETADAAAQKPVLAPFPEPPPALVLTEDEKTLVESGEPVYKKLSEGSGTGRASAVFRVKANQETIWSTIKMFDKYPEWIPNGRVKYAKVYEKRGHRHLVEFKVSAGLWDYTYYINHNFPAPNSSRTWGTWTLDYDKTSEINDSVGYWNVQPVSGMKNVCDVTYSVAISVSGALDWLRPIFEESGVQDATKWLKVRAEERAPA